MNINDFKNAYSTMKTDLEVIRDQLFKNERDYALYNLGSVIAGVKFTIQDIDKLMKGFRKDDNAADPSKAALHQGSHIIGEESKEDNERSNAEIVQFHTE